jgi:ribosomal protein S8
MITLGKFLTIIYEGIKKKKLIVNVPINSIILNILWCLYKNCFISGYIVKDNKVKVFLKYYQGQNILIILKQISKISCRIYYKNNKIYDEKKINNIYIITSSKGILLTENIKKNNKIGGEILFKIK